jgi:integrase
MASLQARHARNCALERHWTTFEEARKKKGCTCKPMYHVVSRIDGVLIREPVGHDRKGAERRLRAIDVQIDEGTYDVVESVGLCDWIDEWLTGFRGKETTRRTYRSTLDYAKAAIGNKPLRRMTPSDVLRFLQHVEKANRNRKRPRDVSPTTLAKHLRQLSVCLQAAVQQGKIDKNPVSMLDKSSKPKPQTKRPSYYTNDELALLWPQFEEQPALAALCRLAVTTGMRFGELAALDWMHDVSLTRGEIEITKTYTPGIGINPTKSGEPRTVDLIPQARRVLEEWIVQTSGKGLVFEHETGGHLDGGQVLDVLYAAMERAGIPRVGERGGKRTFHSFRNTFARITLENGALLEWVQAQLGHSSITLTRDLYGSWSRKAEKQHALGLDGVFTV